MAAQDALLHARELMEKGAYNDALEATAQLAATHPLDAHLIRARIFLETGRFASAETAARAAVDVAGNSFDARFLLALSLERREKYSQAVAQFRLTFDLASSDLERTLVSEAIHRITTKRDWVVSASFGLLPSTNANKVTANDQVDTIFGSSTIEDDPYSGVGVSYSASVRQTSKSPLAVVVSGQMFSDPGLWQTSINLTYSTRLADGSDADVSLLRNWSGGEHQRDQISFEISRKVEIGSQLDASLSSRLSHMAYVAGDKVTGISSALSVPLFSETGYEFSGQFRVDRQASVSTEYASVGAGMSLIAVIDRPVLDVELAASLNARDWDGAYGLFPLARSDLDVLLSARISPNEFSVFGLQPILRASFLNRSSNIAMYDLESFDVYTGLQAAF